MATEVSQVRTLLLSPVLLAVAAGINLVVAAVLIRMSPLAAVAVAVLPLIALVAPWLLTTGRIALFALAIAYPLFVPIPSAPIPLGGANVHPQDLIIVLAVGAWAFARLVDGGRGMVRSVPGTPVVGWPLALFAVMVVISTMRGHNAYGASLLGEPLRLVFYAAIVVTLAGFSGPRQLYRLLLWLFYGGTLFTGMLAVYYVSTGTSQSVSENLSTGGARYLGIGTTLYCAGGLFLALLTVRLKQGVKARLPHLAVAAVAFGCILLGFGRAVYAGVALVGVVFVVVSPNIRQAIVHALPLAVPLLVLVTIGIFHFAPQLPGDVQRRMFSSPTSDSNVQWRVKNNLAVMAQVREQPLYGVGFGRKSEFWIDEQTDNGFIVPVRVEAGQDPHNGFLFLLAGGGILTLGAFLLIVGTFAVDAVSRFRGSTDEIERLLVAWSAVVLFLFLLNAASGTTFESTVSVLTIWALLVLPAIVRRQRDPHDGPRLVGLNRDEMRVLAVSVTTRLHALGGMEEQLHTLVGGLAAQGQRVTVVTSRHPEGLHSEAVDGVEWRYLDAPADLFSDAWATALLEFYEEVSTGQGIDVIHSQSSGALPLVRAHVTTPIVFSLHGNFVSIAAAGARSAARTPTPRGVGRQVLGVAKVARVHFRQANWRAFRNCEAIVPSRNQVRPSRYAHCLRRGHVHVVPNGIDVDLFRPRPRQETRAALGLEQSFPMAVCVGRLDRGKGVLLAVEALGRLRAHPDARLVFVGDGGAEPGIRSLAASLGVADRIVLAGRVGPERVAQYISAADVLVFPSLLGEAFGLVAAQGMASGTPVVASAVGGVPEVLGEDGACGMLVDPGRPDQIADALDRLFSDPALRVQLGRAGRAAAVSRLTAARMACGTAAVYELAIARPRPT